MFKSESHKKLFREMTPKMPFIRLPKINKSDKVLYACHGRFYRTQINKNIFTLDRMSEAKPDIQIAITSKSFKEKLSKYKNFFNKIYMLYCPISAFLLKRKHLIPNKIVFDNFNYILKTNGKLIINNFELFNKNSKLFSNGEYFIKYLPDFKIFKETKEKLILIKL